MVALRLARDTLDAALFLNLLCFCLSLRAAAGLVLVLVVGEGVVDVNIEGDDTSVEEGLGLSDNRFSFSTEGVSNELSREGMSVN